MTQLIGHRGASRDCLENTLEAFSRALDQHADGVELDVHASQDGVVFVHHDPEVRITRDGVTDVAAIAQTASNILHTVRLGDGQPLPTLDQVLDLVGSRATVYVEVKGTGIEQLVVDCLDRHANVATAVHAFDHRIPHEIRRIRPTVRAGVLSASYVLDFACMLEPTGADDLWQQAELIDRTLVDQVHAMGMRIIAWTENSADRARRLMALGVDAICTDVPGQLRQALGL